LGVWWFSGIGIGIYRRLDGFVGDCRVLIEFCCQVVLNLKL